MQLKKRYSRWLAATIVTGATSVLGIAEPALADVQVNVNLGPPPIVISAPPAVVMMPGSGVYFVPDVSFDVFFYNGYWWSPRGPHWYHAPNYNGPWAVVEARHVPVAVVRVPKDYRMVYKKEKSIPYGQWKKQGGHAEREIDRNDDKKEFKQEKGEHGQGHGHNK